MKRVLAILAAGFAVLIGKAAPIAASDVRVSAALSQPGASLSPQVDITPRADGATVVEVRLTNRSTRDVELLGAEVEFPWIAPSSAAFRVAAGAMSSGRWPSTLVFDPAKDPGEPVSGMYLLAKSDGEFALAGFLSWRTFWSKLRYRAGKLIMSADGEGRRIRAGETVTLEKVRFVRGPDWQDLLFGYGDAIARELRLAPKPPRRFIGWSTWDYYGRGFSAEAVRGNVAALKTLLPSANLVQIDGGWWRDRGDYGGTREDLGPDAMKTFAADFRAQGLTAGVHLDGMRFSPESIVAREHPEFFLHDEHGALLRERTSLNGQVRHLFVDYSHPGACAYMRETLRRLRRDWGFDYFKIDFLRAGIAEDIRRDAFDNDPARRIVAFDAGLTSVERLHRALMAFRAGMGDDAYFVGCSTPFGPTFGHVDALRTGPDISPRFTAYQSQCEANAGNFYLHGRVVDVDADYLVVRAREDQDATLVKERIKDGGDLAQDEAEMWADYVALFSGPKIASDNLMILREERKALVRFAALQPSCARFVPLDFWEHARTRADPFQVFLGEAGRDVLLAVFNWNGAPHTYTFRGLPSGTSLAGAVIRGAPEVARSENATQVTLGRHHAAIFRLPAGADFEQLRHALDVR
jgi:alpha-galactosidase